MIQSLLLYSMKESCIYPYAFTETLIICWIVHVLAFMEYVNFQ